MTVGAIVAELKLDLTNFREGLVRANSLLEQYRGEAGRAATMLAGIAAAAAGGMGAAVKWSVEFEREMRNVNSILQETEPNLRALSQQVLDLAGRTGQAPAVLARGLYDIASSGFNGADGIKVLTAAARAATAGLTDTATASRAIVAAINAYGLTADDAARISDIMFKTVERGVLTFGDLAQNLGDVVAMGATAKVPLEELGAAIAAMTKAGIQPAEAFTSLNMVLRSFIDPTDDAKAAAQQLGLQLDATALASKGLVALFQDIGRAIGGSAEDIDNLTKAGATEEEVMAAVARNAGVTTEALSALFPNVRALRGALVMAAEGGRRFSDEMAAMAQAGGATERALKQQAQSLSLQWSRTWEGARALAIEFGQSLLPALKALIEALRSATRFISAMPPQVRVLMLAAGALAAVLPAVAAGFILWRTQIAPAVPLMLGMVSAMRQVATGAAAANITLATSFGAIGGILAQVKLAFAAVVAQTAALRASLAATIPTLTAARVGHLALAGAAKLVGAALSALAVSAVAVVSAALNASQDVEEFNDTLLRLEERAQKARAEMQRFPQELKLTWWQAFLQHLTPIEGEITRLRREQMMLFEGGVELAERRRAAEEAAAKASEDAERKLAEVRQTALENELARIERERQARIKAGVDERLANELAEQERVAARERSQAEALKLEAELLEAEGRTHEARVKAIIAEAETWRKENEKKVGSQRAAEMAERMKRAQLIELDRQEAQERVQAFEDAAGRIISAWTSTADAMRSANRITAAEHLSQLSQVLDLIQQINAARARAGATPLFSDEELRLAQQIVAAREEWQSQLEAGEKRLSTERQQWTQQELQERQRLHDYELSMIDLRFQHERDLARVAGREDERSMARIAQAELAALQQRRSEEQLTAEARLQSLERERELILQIAQAGMIRPEDATKQLEAVYSAMGEARDEINEQERQAFEERKRQHDETVKQIETEQKTLRDQLSETGGRIAKLAEDVFGAIERRLRSIASIRLEPAVAAAGAARGGGRVINVYLNTQRVAASADVTRIADQLAEMLEREARYARD